MEWQELGKAFDDLDTARIVEQGVNRLDRAIVDQHYAGRGSKPFDPIPLLKMVLYQYLKGNQSPAKWLEEAKLNQAMRWLGRGYTPGRRTWYEFRDRAGKFIEVVHQQIIRDAIKDNLVDPSVGVQDGTSVAAAASRHRMVNQSTLEKRRKQLDSIVEETFEGELPTWVPPTQPGRIDLRRRMERAAVVLAKRLEQNATKSNGKRKDSKKIFVSLSDPDAPLGRDKLKVYRPLYTQQHVVAPNSRIILAYTCNPSVTDVGTLPTMVDKTQQVVEKRLKTMIADGAYCSIVDLMQCAQRNVELIAPSQTKTSAEAVQKTDAKAKLSRADFQFDSKANEYICPEGKRLSYVSRNRKERHSNQVLWESRYACDPLSCSACPLAERCLRPGAKSRMMKRLEGEELMEAHRKKMETPEAQRLYALRGQTVEITFADPKGNRRWDRFHGRGTDRVQAETGLAVVAQNLLRLDRLRRERLKPSDTTT